MNTFGTIRLFNLIVESARKSSGLPYDTVFNRALRNNRDLLQGRHYDPTQHTFSFTKLLNRADVALGGSPAVATVGLVAGKVNRLANRHLPGISKMPAAGQWDIISRAVTLAEELGVTRLIMNSKPAPPISPAEWNAANDRADDVLAFLEHQEEASKDAGNSPRWQKLPPQNKFWSLQHQIERLIREENLTPAAAFEKLRREQPIFWAHGVLGFQADNGKK